MTAIKDFSRQREKIEFTIDGDLFEGPSAIPAQTLLNFAKDFGSMDPATTTVDNQLAAFRSVLSIALLPESFARFEKRMSDVERPIEMSQVEQIIEWLFEKHGLRPTQLSSGSPDGQLPPGSGITSTESTRDVELISSASPSTSS